MNKMHKKKTCFDDCACVEKIYKSCYRKTLVLLTKTTWPLEFIFPQSLSIYIRVMCELGIHDTPYLTWPSLSFDRFRGIRLIPKSFVNRSRLTILYFYAFNILIINFFFPSFFHFKTNSQVIEGIWTRKISIMNVFFLKV